MTTQRTTNETQPTPTKKVPQEVSFNIYINKVLKSMHPDVGLTGESQVQLDLMIKQLIRELTRRSVGFLHQTNHKQTLGLREFQFATRLVLQANLAKHANNEGLKAEETYKQSRADRKDTKEGKPMQKSAQAGLQFSVPRVRTIISQYAGTKRLGDLAVVYTTAVVEYLVAELLDLSSKHVLESKKQRITPHHLAQTISGDRELSRLFRNYVFPIRDPRPFTHST